MPVDSATNFGLADFARRGRVAWKRRSVPTVLTRKWEESSAAGVERAGPQWLAMPALAITTSRCLIP